jgi:hypothetical protein
MTVDEFIEYLNKEIEDAENYLAPARDSLKQKEKCFFLERILQNVASAKSQVIAYNDEFAANLFLGFECVIGCIMCELRMWIFIKQDKPNEAFDDLIAAQMGASDAIRAHTKFSHLTKNLKRLEDIELLMFPPQVYLSSGFKCARLKCSICGEDYSACDHLKDRPYMGIFCQIIYQEMEVDHVAIVERPSDKRCRVTKILTPDGYQDKMSLLIIPTTSEQQYSDERFLYTESYVYVTDRYPYLNSSKNVFDAISSPY